MCRDLFKGPNVTVKSLRGISSHENKIIWLGVAITKFAVCFDRCTGKVGDHCPRMTRQHKLVEPYDPHFHQVGLKVTLRYFFLLKFTFVLSLDLSRLKQLVKNNAVHSQTSTGT